MSHPIPSKTLNAALVARSNLYVWGSVVDLLEGSSGQELGRAKERVIRIAQAEMQRELARMDKAVAKLAGTGDAA